MQKRLIKFMEASKDNTLFISESLEGRLNLDTENSNSSNDTCSVLFDTGGPSLDFELKKLSFRNNKIVKIHLFCPEKDIKRFIETHMYNIFVLHRTTSMTGQVDSIVKKSSGNWTVKISIYNYAHI